MRFPLKNSQSSIVSLYLILAFYLISFLFYQKWRESTLITGDTAGYYVYLPAAFIYHDLNNLKATATAAGKYRPDLYQSHKITGGIELPNGNLINKYPSGIALMHLPFFLLAILASFIFGYHVDGFSPPFQILISLGSLTYVIAGLVLLRRLLKKYFDDSIVAIVLIIVTVATNLYYYAIYENLMSHVYLFCLYAALLFCSDEWYRNLKSKYALLIGLCCGLITVSRPNEIICLFIPILYGVTSIKSFLERPKFLWLHSKDAALAAIAFCIVGLPQLIYWKLLSGNFLFYSYGSEGFDFSHPHILEGLFSFQNGWLIYSPIMIFSIGGLFFLPKTNEFRLGLIIYLVIYLYVIYSYWSWNYYNGFGSRPMVETYPLLALPLGYFTKWVINRRIPSTLYSLFIVFFIALNIFQVWQTSRGILLTCLVNAHTYTYLFGKTSTSTKALIIYDLNQPQPDNLTYQRTVFAKDFNDSLDQHYQLNSSGGFFYLKVKEDEFAELGKLTNQNGVLQKGERLKVHMRVKNDNYLPDLWRMTSIVSSINDNGKSIFWKNVRVQNKSDSTRPGLWNCATDNWYNIDYFLSLPAKLPKDFELNFYLWDACKCNEVAMDDFKIEVWR